MTLTRWGRSKSLIKAPLSTLTATGPRVEYKRGISLSEWYMNSPWGLEQGFTVNQKPSTQNNLPSSLILELTLSGTLQPALQGNTLLLSDSTGLTRIRYTGLYAFDSEGKTLNSRLALKGDTLRILIDDTAASYPITIDPWVQKAKLTASDGAADDHFGYSVAISNDTVVIAALEDIWPYPSQGSAYVFVRSGSTWTQTAKLTASDGYAYDYFGRSVAISGDMVVVGADNESAYVFKKPLGGWATMTETHKLTANDGVGGDEFGKSVAISGDTVVVGARGANTAYVFSYMYLPVFPPVYFWSQTAKLTASDGASSDSFGHSVAISGDTVVVGADCADDNGSASGSAYVFKKPLGGWATMTETHKLTASDGASGDYFGHSVAISNDRVVVVGALDDDDNGSSSGSAYIFSYIYIPTLPPVYFWLQTAKLTASDGYLHDHFGISVSISGDTVVVGADHLHNGMRSGAVYVFEKPPGGWANMTQTDKLTASDGMWGDSFGTSVSISGDTLMVGAHGDDIGTNTDQGSAYVFKLTPILAPILMLLL